MSTLGHGIGIESEHGFPSIIGAKLNIDKVQEQSRFQCLMASILMLHEMSSEVANELMHKPDHDQSLR